MPRYPEKFKPRVEEKQSEEFKKFKESSQFKEFLTEQISLPPKEWDEKFKKYTEEKHKESQKEIPERSFEKRRELTFEIYLKGSGFNIEDLKDKRILDIGCGAEADFVKKCLDSGISKEVYGLDLTINPDVIEGKYKEHLFKGNFEEKFPVRDLDYVVSIGAVEAPSSGLDKINLQKTLLSALKAIKEKGEIRIYPIHRAPPGSELKGIDFSRKKWMEVLKDLSTKKEIEYELHPVDITVAGRKPNVWLEEVLIIKKKSPNS